MRNGFDRSTLTIVVCDLTEAEPEERVMIALEILWHLCQEGQHLEVAQFAAILPPPKEMISIVEGLYQHPNQCRNGDAREVKRIFAQKLALTLKAVKTSCEYLIRNSIWACDENVQLFLLDFMKKSERKEEYWKAEMLKCFLESEDLNSIQDWVDSFWRLKIVIRRFGLPKDKISTRVEELLLEWSRDIEIENWINSVSGIRMLMKVFNVSEKNIHKMLTEQIDKELEKSPRYCLEIAKEFGLPIHVWRVRLYTVADNLLLAANKENNYTRRANTVRAAILIHQLIKKWHGDTSTRGNSYITVWDDEKSKNAARNVLRKATTEYLKVPYSPIGPLDYAWSIASKIKI